MSTHKHFDKICCVVIGFMLILTVFFMTVEAFGVSEEATVSSSVDFALCSFVGLITTSPSTIPTNTLETGPFQGISEIESARDAPIRPVTSGLQSGSTERTRRLSVTSFLKSLGKRGRIGLSITRLVRIAFSEGLPSLFIKEPGILPTA